MIIKFKKILAIGAHLDDIELGCAGVISRFSRKAEFKVLVLSKDRRNSKGEVQEIRKINEASNAMKYMGLKKSNLFIENIPTQLFDSYAQEIREALIYYKKKLNPDLVFITSRNDIHQDHRVLCEQSDKVFKRTTRLGYEIINSSFSFQPQLYVELTKTDIERKVKAISAYKSQMNPDITTADYFSKEVTEALAISRGAKIGVPYAEAFEVYHFEVK